MIALIITPVLRKDCKNLMNVGPGKNPKLISIGPTFILDYRVVDFVHTQSQLWPNLLSMRFRKGFDTLVPLFALFIQENTNSIYLFDLVYQTFEFIIEKET